jgi:hypothetical protein
MRAVANKYNIIQVGLILFFKIDENNYEARPYNAFVFPREQNGFSPTITLDASSMEFNMRHGMDFQKWIYKGKI